MTSAAQIASSSYPEGGESELKVEYGNSQHQSPPPALTTMPRSVSGRSLESPGVKWPAIRAMDHPRPGSGSHWITPEIVQHAFATFAAEDARSKPALKTDSTPRWILPPHLIPLPDDSSSSEDDSGSSPLPSSASLSDIAEAGMRSPRRVSINGKRQSVSRYPAPLDTPRIPPALEVIEPTPRPLSAVVPPQNDEWLRIQARRRRSRRSRERREARRRSTGERQGLILEDEFSISRQPLDFSFLSYDNDENTPRPPSRRGSSNRSLRQFHTGDNDSSNTNRSFQQNPEELNPTSPERSKHTEGVNLDKQLKNGRKASWIASFKSILTPSAPRPRVIKGQMRYHRDGDRLEPACCIVS